MARWDVYLDGEPRYNTANKTEAVRKRLSPRALRWEGARTMKRS